MCWIISTGKWRFIRAINGKPKFPKCNVYKKGLSKRCHEKENSASYSSRAGNTLNCIALPDGIFYRCLAGHQCHLQISALDCHP